MRKITHFVLNTNSERDRLKNLYNIATNDILLMVKNRIIEQDKEAPGKPVHFVPLDQVLNAPFTLSTLLMLWKNVEIAHSIRMERVEKARNELNVAKNAYGLYHTATRRAKARVKTETEAMGACARLGMFLDEICKVNNLFNLDGKKEIMAKPIYFDAQGFINGVFRLIDLYNENHDRFPEGLDHDRISETIYQFLVERQLTEVITEAMNMDNWQQIA